MSVSHKALASATIMPLCMATGLAAGAVAGLAARDGLPPRGIDILKLRGILREQGGRVD